MITIFFQPPPSYPFSEFLLFRRSVILLTRILTTRILILGGGKNLRIVRGILKDKR